VPPPLLLAGALVVTILVGSFLLWLPVAHSAGTVSWLDALFTATSAACVTGLSVVDIGTRFTPFGQVVILLLIQIGGLGIMTIGTVVLMAFGQRPTGVLRALLRGFASHRPQLRARDIMGTVFLVTLVVELAGAALLFLAFVREHPVDESVWLAVFHSVSAFCNAGFGLWPDSLVHYASSPLVNFTVMALIIFGGLGFVVLLEVAYYVRSCLRRSGQVNRLSLHSKIVLSASLVAVAVGMVLFLILESDNALADRPWDERFLIASFQSVTARTAGFNTIDIAALSNPMLLILILLMFVGGGPGSMAGGIKLTSAATVLAMVYHRLRGSREVRMFGRAIGEITLQRAAILAILSSLLIVVTVCAMEMLRAGTGAMQRGDFFAVTFEAVSAFGTVGLSMGITPTLEVGGKILIIALMFVGRLGPLWLMDFLQHLPMAPPVRHAKEELMVG
jgi:trk system potassium uptake protein TrkH